MKLIMLLLALIFSGVCAVSAQQQVEPTVESLTILMKKYKAYLDICIQDASNELTKRLQVETKLEELKAQLAKQELLKVGDK